MSPISTKKKILFFIPTFPVLSETFIEREICELKSRGNIDVHVVTLRKGSNLNCTDLADSITYLSLNYKDILSGLVKFISEDPITLWRTRALINKNRNKNYFENFYLWFKSVGYANLLSKFQFDKIHAHFLSEPSTIALIVALLLDKPLSISGHARDVFGEKGGPELIPEKLRYAKFVALCNKKAYVHCVNLAGTKDKNKSHLLPHGVDTSINFDKNHKNEVPVIFFLGRFVEKKGLVYLLEAAKALSIKGENFKLQLAGYGPQYKELQSISNKLSISNKVEFINEGKGLSSDVALDLMSKSDIVVMPSIDLSDGDSDGVPNNILEAGIFSKPVTSTNAGSISEVIKHNKTGIVIKQKSSEELAEALSLLIHDQGLRKSLGENLNKFVKEHYDIKNNIVELEKLLIN